MIAQKNNKSTKLKLQQRSTSQVVVIHLNSCLKFSQNVSENSQVNLRNTESDFRAPLMRTKNEQKYFSYCGASGWNQLSSNVKLASLINILKTFTNDSDDFLSLFVIST